MWIGRNEQVQMVRHNLQRQNLNAQLFSDLTDNFFKPNFEVANENLPTTFRTPNQMIIQQIDLMLALLVVHNI